MLEMWWEDTGRLAGHHRHWRAGRPGGAETIARFRGRHAATARAGYYDVTMPERVMLAVLYFGLIALIAVTMLTNPVIRHLF